MTDNPIVTCEMHGEQLPPPEAREQGWRLKEDGFAATVCQRFVDNLAIDRIEREEFEQ